MSKPRIAALVCEGQTDVPILRALLQEVWPELEEVRCLQPELDETDRAKGPSGWTHVKAWCEAHADDLGEVLDPDVGDRIDLLVIAIDVDIALAAKIADPPRAVGLYETKRLRDTMGGWLVAAKRKGLPAGVILSTPVMAVEAWIVAALFPKENAPEAIHDPASWLVARGKLRLGKTDGKPWKELHRYRDFAATVAHRVQRVRSKCVEAHRTLLAVEQRRSDLSRR
jgi:hypothetical protein